jgi:hypothetical protein
MVLGSTHPLTEMSTTKIFLGVNAAGAYLLHVLIVMKSGILNLLALSGPYLILISNFVKISAGS